MEIDNSSSLSIDVKLNNFYVKNICTDGLGKQTLGLLTEATSDLTYQCTAHISLDVKLVKDGIEINKKIKANADTIAPSEITNAMIGNSIHQANN